ncbi:sensor histidine kinase [Sporomusa aerivorans]|uniref:sensor histidine kinase n=1 Tax=Sporomusa aerivorans TaxID=204936 RepID=UPI00352AF3A8
MRCSVKELWYKLSIKNKIILYFVVVMLLPNLMSIFTQFAVYQAMNHSNANLNYYNRLYQLKKYVNENKILLQNYIQYKDNHSCEELLAGQSLISEMVDELRREVDNEKIYLVQKSVDFYLMSYLEESNKAVNLRQKADSTGDYYTPFFKALTLSRYLENEISELIRIRLIEGNQHFTSTMEEVNVVKNISVTGNLVVILLILLFGYIFTNYLTKPIRQLAEASNQMATGDFNIDQIHVKSSDEVGILAHSFNKMNENIKQLVKDLQEKSRVEKMLHEQELKNVEMEKLLNDAKYTSLQSQINPHYLFNTLNMIARTSMFENAEKTTRLIQSLAKMFRYHLEDHSKAVSLKKEVDIVKEYIFIQNERFSDRIRLEIIWDNHLDMENIYLPCFSIQPLVENGIIHGLEPLERGGRLRIRIYSEDGQVIISIADNGTGISKNKLQHAMGVQRKEANKGIGISNVANRLKLFFHTDCLTIRSKLGLGTIVKIVIPINR